QILLTAPQTLAAVETLVTSPIAHGHVAAIGAGGRVLLEMSERIIQRSYCMSAARVAIRQSCAAGLLSRNLQNLRVLRQRQIRHWPVHFFFDLFHQVGHWQLRLSAVRAVRIAEAGNELEGHPAEDIVSDGRGVANLRVLREPGRLEALVG